MRAWRIVAVVSLMAFTAGCYGPNALSRGLDAWGNQLYVDNPWVAQLGHFTGVFLVGHLVASAIDYVVLNPFDFWGVAVPTGHGTPYVYPTPMRPIAPLRPYPWQLP